MKQRTLWLTLLLAPWLSPQRRLAPAAAAKKTNSPAGLWLDASVRAIEGAEFSVYGVLQADGGVILLDVPADSAAARAGLQKNDLIQGINASKVSNVQELTAAFSAAGKGPIEVRFVRGQKPQSLKLGPNRERPLARLIVATRAG